METIIDKIQKLIAKAESLQGIGSLAEAEIFMKKANDLIMQHNIDRSKLRTEANKFEGWVFSDYFQPSSKICKTWERNLLFVICNHNLCALLISHNRRRQTFFRIIGDNYNVQTCRYVYNFLSTKIEFIARSEWKKLLKQGVSPKYRAKFYKSFLSGAVMGLDQSMKPDCYEGTMNLIKVNKTDLIEFAKTQIPDIKNTRKRTVNVDNSAFNSGFETGRQTQVGKSIAQQKVESKLLS